MKNNKIAVREERHYPSFLDSLKNIVIQNIIHHIEMTKNAEVTHFIYEINVETKYVDNIVIDISLQYGEDINEKHNYNAYYYNVNGELVNNKLNKPQIIISCPFDGKSTNYSILKYCVSHELTHMYDDWVRLTNFKEGINFNKKNVSTTLFVQKCMEFGSEFYKGIGGLCYMSLKVEKQAFLSQTIQELEGIGCDPYNYRNKMKETVLYNNLTKSYNMFMYGINKCTDSELVNFNSFVFLNFPQSNIPKYDIRNLNSKLYRNKLIKWGDNVYYKVMHSYNVVISYYVDKMKDKLLEKKCILML